MMNEKNKEILIEKHCKLEADKEDKYVQEVYSSRMNAAINTSIIKPYCIPIDEGLNDRVVEWISSNDILLEKGFGFYHHSPEEVINFAIENRGNFEYILKSMNDLYLEEIPNPFKNGYTYMVAENGQHRRMVYNCLDLPVVKASVYKTSGKSWKYYSRGYNHTVLKILVWLLDLGLINQIEKEDYKFFLIQGKNNIAPWILPNPEHGNLYKMIKDMKERITCLEKAFPDCNKEIPPILKSKLLWKYSLEKSYIKHFLILGKKI